MLNKVEPTVDAAVDAPAPGDAEVAAAADLRFAPHPRRGALLAEAHARPFHPTSFPCRYIHFAFATDAEQALADCAALGRFCRDLGLPEPTTASKHHRIQWPSLALRWEQHTEFTTYTWEHAGAGADLAAGALSAGMHKLPQPGPLLVAVDLQLVDAPITDAAAQFQAASLAMGYLDDRAALTATDFRPDADGFVRFIVANIALTPIRAGALAQRLLELETYRMFALLGLPEAQRLEPEVRSIERELTVISERMTRAQGLMANHELLEMLTALAARLEAGATTSLYRFAASRAYEEIVQGRIEAIKEEPYPGASGFSSFMSRRLAPAMRTCKTMEDRQANLSRKLARAAQLLRTRVDVELEQQNHDLLASMNTRTRLQLRLQRTVEALSIAAASYYVVGLLSHVMVLLPRFGMRIDPEMATALAVPLVVIGIASLFVLRLRALKNSS